ncbi:MAG: hypothetical protein NUV58_04810 [Candidatus Roizmanbacteria bacterium]|nr:hypothetical protein [Candidatus Roizmanbacteria bacterium]
MKTKHQVQKELEKYKILDDLVALKKAHMYEETQPLSEYARQRDIGYRKALTWVLEVEKNYE